jgi:hypothetical protein
MQGRALPDHRGRAVTRTDVPGDDEPLDLVPPPEELPDAQLVEPALADPEGPHRAALQDRLATYGFTVLTGWARGGELHHRAAEAKVLGLTRLPVELDDSVEEAVMVAVDAVTMALRSFWGKPLGKWDPAGGAGVKTYFVTHCLRQLPGAYDRYFRCEIRPQLVQARAELVDELFTDPDPDPGPEEVAEVLELVAQLARDDRRTQRLLILRVHGHTYREIAEQLSDQGPHTTEGQVRRALKKVAQDARELRRRRR